MKDQKPGRAGLGESPMIGVRALLKAWPAALSVLALGVSLASAWFSYHHGRAPAGLLKKYDFTSPETALRSEFAMTRDGDFDGIRAYYREFNRGIASEALDTLKIERSREFRGAKVLFLSFTDRGEPIRECRFFVRDAESGLWGEDRKMRVRIKDRDVTAAMYQWEHE